MTIEKKGEQDALKLAKEALEKTDKEKYPKTYKLREDLVKALEYGSNQKIRAEKAEKKSKTSTPEKETLKNPTEQEPPKTTGLSPEDVLLFINAKITHPDDIQEVKDYAAYKGISNEEALKSSVVKTTLQTKAEERKTAEAANTGGGKRGTSKATGKELLHNFEKTGELPESDEDMKKLVDAQYPTPK